MSSRHSRSSSESFNEGSEEGTREGNDMRDCPRVVLTAELVRYARKFVEKNPSTTFSRELACLAGSLFLFGGRGNYYIGREMFKSLYDFGGMNVRHFGIQVDSLKEIESAEFKVPGTERREGWIYVVVALSPVLNEGTDKEKVAALIYGYMVDKNVPEQAGELQVSFMTTTALPPFAHRGVTNERAKIYWPDSGLSRPWGTKRNEEKSLDGSGTTHENDKNASKQ